jgi:hypothetical protein
MMGAIHLLVLAALVQGDPSSAVARRPWRNCSNNVALSATALAAMIRKLFEPGPKPVT